MAEKYFQRFPRISYSNSQVIDITKRVKLLDTVSNNPYVFYSYDIGDSERADSFSNRYYEDPYMSWLLYLSNNILDPYYEWYLTEKELNEFITSKYGSLENAKLKVKYYRNNWENQEEISVSAYNSLTSDQKSFWEPVYRNNNIFRYKRKELDIVSSTNRIVSYTVSNTDFVYDELCDIVFDTGITARAQVVQSSDNTVFVQHITGDYNDTVTANSYIYGRESGVNTAFTAVSVSSNNISSSTESYFSAVTYYDYEYEKNEYNRTIRVIDSEYKYDIAENFKALMRT